MHKFNEVVKLNGGITRKCVNCGMVESFYEHSGEKCKSPQKDAAKDSTGAVGSISFDGLAKDCPAQNTGGKCTIRSAMGAYYPIKCKETMCPIWHFVKAMMVEK